jgi:hypothetical protein
LESEKKNNKKARKVGEATFYFQLLVEVVYAAQHYHQTLQLHYLNKMIKQVRYYNKNALHEKRERE